jgi:hypothetical protein
MADYLKNAKQKTLLRRTFVDICNSYSIGKWRDLDVYIRHMSHKDHLLHDDMKERFYKEAIAKGLPSEEEKIKFLINKGLWSNERENEIARQELFVRSSEDGRKHLNIPSLLEKHNKMIEKELEKLHKMYFEKANLIGLTAEGHANRKIEDHYLLCNTFDSKNLDHSLFSNDEFDDLSDFDVSELNDVYTKSIAHCSDSNIRLLAVQDFYQHYYGLCKDNLQSFFGKPICELTYFQISLGNHSRYFRNIMENNDLSHLSPEKRENPDEIEKHVIAKRNTDAALAEGRAPVGMTKEDIKSMGLEGKMGKLPDKNMSGAEFMRFLENSNSNRQQ